MKAFIFLPDTRISAGLGHLSRCIKFSEFIKSANFVLVRKEMKLNFLNKNVKKKIIKYTNLKSTLNNLKKKYQNINLIIDTYNKRTMSFDFKKYSSNQIFILDYKIKNNFQHILDHTFKRNNKFFSFLRKKQKVNYGLLNFPIKKRIIEKKKQKILIDYGTVRNKNAINSALSFIEKIPKLNNYKIVVINKFFKKSMIYCSAVKKRTSVINYTNQIEELYSKSLFSFGSCGISLYEKSFYRLPTIAICSSFNQKYNFSNFKKYNCILDYKTIKKYTLNSRNNDKLFEDLHLIKKNLIRHFNTSKNKKNLYQYFTKF